MKIGFQASDQMTPWQPAVSKPIYKSRACLILAALIAFVSLITFFVSAPIEIGHDEHYTVTRAFLWSRGYPLYTRIWSDQPPVYTLILGSLFKCLSPSIVVARGLAVTFGVLLFTCFFLLVKSSSGLLGACIATATLLTAPEVFDLSVSSMLDVPVIAMGLWAFWMFSKWMNDSSRLWLTMSALVLAVSLQVKFTTAFIIPVMAAGAVFISHEIKRERKRVMTDVALWFAIIVSAFFLIGWVSGAQYDQALQSHFSSEAQKDGPSFALQDLLQYPEGLLGATVGLLVAAFRSHWQRIWLPTVLLTLTIAIHYFHRPYWHYYFPHFAIPLAWLSGHGLAELLRWLGIRKHSAPFRSFYWWGGCLLASTLVTAFFGFGGTRMVADIAELERLPRPRNNPVIAEMGKYSAETKWVYSEGSIYPFYARLPVIPELAVLSHKRFWSGQIDDQEVFAIVQQYKPEQILVYGGIIPPTWHGFLESNYTLVAYDQQLDLYIESSVVKSHGH
jgi:4-amino-4-deoxy-L-arabinose transferase-like glycosyltransferase